MLGTIQILADTLSWTRRRQTIGWLKRNTMKEGDPSSTVHFQMGKGCIGARNDDTKSLLVS